MGFLLFGGPGETRESVEESVQFVDSLPLDSVKITSGIRVYPGTKLSALAMREGKISIEDDLLQPRFYMAENLSPEWLRRILRQWKSSTHLTVIMDD